MTPTEPSRISAIKIAIAVIPALLIVSICIALYLGANEEQEENKPIEGEITVSELVDFVRKLNGLIEVRGLESEEGIRGLRQTAATIKGTLGPENLGYRIFTSEADPAAGLLWETIWIDAGDQEGGDPVVLAIPYGEGGTEVAFALGFAEYLTSHPAKKPVQLVFYPPLPKDEGLPQWVQSRSLKGLEAEGFVSIRGGGRENRWASVQVSGEDRSKMQELLGRQGWEGQMDLVDEAGAYTEILLGEMRSSERNLHAQNMLRLMPFLKAVVDGVSP